MASNMVEEECGDVFGVVRGRARDEVGMFGQAANNDVDAIMPAVGLGEAPHEVHGDGLPPDGGDDGVVSADGEVLSVEVRAPDCEGVNHGEEFLLVGGVIHLRGKELLACQGNGVFARWSLGVSGRVLDGGGLDGVAGEMLGQYGSNGEVGGVSGNIEMASGVGNLEDRGRGDGLLESSGGGLAGELCGVGALGLLVPQLATTEAASVCLEDWAMLREDGVDAVAEASAANEVEADTTAAATAAATSAAARWEVSFWRGGMRRCRCGRGGGGEGIYNIN
ncbi:hypothetical protein CBR_g57008 [Chara braunii]|uniref:Uncharacterized protein n=1 Tax=Chara braunii TaxID=69332 RepID=A0A388ME39_CHABU|nr:hypothetical protein CBR_g57008 [Chara braunii]|eukprot:GBG92765.1 hypothetical protein CBR_g57008 [Chara braunii]